MDIRLDPLTHADVIALLEFHTADMAAHSPEGTSYALDLDKLKTPDISVFTIKSMRTAQGFEQRGIGGALLRHIIKIAQDRSYKRLYLETGTTPLFHKAISFYAGHGFVLGEKFSDYIPSRYNIFMHLEL